MNDHPLRRAADKEVGEMKELLVALKFQLEDLQQQIIVLQPKVDELTVYLERGKGVAWFLKMLLLLGGPISAIGAFVLWAKDHVKW